MNVSCKYILCNRYVMGAFWGALILQISSCWIFGGDLITILRLGMDWYLRTGVSFSYYPIEGFSIMQVILPLVASVIALPFIYERSNYAYIYPRTYKWKNYVIKRIMGTLLWGCTMLYVAYLIFLFIGAAVLPIENDVQRELFSEIWGAAFSQNHPVLYYMVEGFVRYFIFVFVYGLFTIAINFWTEKIYVCVLAPMIYFGGIAVLISVLESLLYSMGIFPNLLVFSPTYTIMSNARAYVSGVAIFLPLVPVLLFSAASIGYRLYGDRKRDIYAAL